MYRSSLLILCAIAQISHASSLPSEIDYQSAKVLFDNSRLGSESARQSANIASQRIDDTKKYITDLVSEIETLGHVLEEGRVEKSDLESLVTNLNDDIENLSAKNIKLNERQNRLSQDVNDIQREVSRIESDLQRPLQERYQAQLRSDELNSSYNQLSVERDNLIN